jgi:hypothetical protein
MSPRSKRVEAAFAHADALIAQPPYPSTVRHPCCDFLMADCGSGHPALDQMCWLLDHHDHMTQALIAALDPTIQKGVGAKRWKAICETVSELERTRSALCALLGEVMEQHKKAMRLEAEAEAEAEAEEGSPHA